MSFSEKSFIAWQSSHVVNNSWLPLFMSGSAFSLMCSSLYMFKLGFNFNITLSSFFMSVILFMLWFQDTTRESTYQGKHSNLVQAGLKWGLVWFLFSEVWFFFSVFWSFFHFSSAPITSSISVWPLMGLETIPVFQVPLLNTVILLMSGVTATLAHLETLKGNKSVWILTSALLGLYFLILQSVEYFNSSFSMASSSYGSIFFFGTGFHGLHVTLGMVMLFIMVYRIKHSLVTGHHHFSLEFSLWYWHFVDVVWLILFTCVYTWGSV